MVPLRGTPTGCRPSPSGGARSGSALGGLGRDVACRRAAARGAHFDNRAMTPGRGSASAAITMNPKLTASANTTPLNSVKGRKLLRVLRCIQQTCDQIRRQIGIRAPGEIIARYDVFEDLDSSIIVVADGFGGASVQEVEGNYPVDFLVKNEREFRTEELACAFAQELDQGAAKWEVDKV